MERTLSIIKPDATRRNLLETTPAHLITTAVVPPATIGGSYGAAALLEKGLGKKDKNKTIIEDESNLAASEVIGDIDTLLQLANKH